MLHVMEYREKVFLRIIKVVLLGLSKLYSSFRNMFSYNYKDYKIFVYTSNIASSNWITHIPGLLHMSLLTRKMMTL